MKINNKSTTKFPGARCLHIVTNLAHLSKELAIEICNEKLERHQLLTYGLCVHDMDTYTEDDIERLNVRRQNEQLRLYMEYEPDDVHTAEEAWTPSPEAWKRAEKEALEKFPERTAGDKKPLHVHIVLSFSCSRKVDEIARWFGIEPCFVETKTGRNAVLYALRYLTHNHKGNETEQKFVYPASIVSFRSIVPEYENLPYGELLSAVEQKEELYDKYNASKEVLNDYVNKIIINAPHRNADGSMGVHSRASFIEDFTYAVYLRNQKLVDAAESARDVGVPAERQVYYIGSSTDPDNKAEMGGVGKSSAAKQLARDIAIKFYGASPTENLSKQNAYIFYAGKSGSIFQRYTNQPIVVMDEISPASLRKAFDGYEGVKSFLDSHPTPEPVNIKFGDTIVTAKYIIMTGIQNIKDFIKSLAGEYTDNHGNHHDADTDYIEQYERRIWAYIAFNGVDNYSLSLNKEFFPFGRKMKGFASWGTYRCDFKGVQSHQGVIFEKDLQYKLMSQMLSPLMSQIEEREKHIAKPQLITSEEYESDDVLQAYYSQLGQIYMPPLSAQYDFGECPNIEDLPEPPELDDVKSENNDSEEDDASLLPFDTD